LTICQVCLKGKKRGGWSCSSFWRI